MSLEMRTQQLNKKVKELVRRSWMPYVWVALITLFGATLRFYKLGAWSFWIDEIYTINHSMAHFSTPKLILDNIPPSRNWMPISVILNAQALNIWGVSEWSARFTSALIGILTIPILYVPVKRIFGGHVALVALLLLAVSPWHIFWSQNARFYTSLMLLYSLALFAFHFGIEEDKPGYLFLFFILVYLAASERLTALFIFPVVFIYLTALWILKFEKPRGLNFRNFLIICMPILLGTVVEIYFRLIIGESRFFADFTWFSQFQVDDPFRLLVFIGNNLGVPLMVMVLFSGMYSIGKKNRSGLLMVVSAIVPLSFLLLLNLFVFTKDRYIFITLFCWIILTASGVKEINSVLRGNLKWLASGFFFVFFLYSINNMLLYYHANQGNRLPWKSAFSFVTEQANEDDIVVAYWPEFGPYYMNRIIIPYSNVDINNILESGKRYWFVLDSETVWLNSSVKSWLEVHAELVNVWYLRLPEDNSLRIYLLNPAQNLGP